MEKLLLSLKLIVYFYETIYNLYINITKETKQNLQVLQNTAKKRTFLNEQKKTIIFMPIFRKLGKQKKI